MKQLHPRAVWLFFWQSVVVWLFILIVASMYLIPFLIVIFGPMVNENERKISILLFFFPIFAWLLFILFVVFLIYIWAKLAYKNYRYQITEEGVKIERGVIWKHYVTIPIERIQNVDIYRGVLARLLGLSDLHIQTAGLSANYYGRWGIGGVGAEGRLPGLGIKDAEDLREELINRMKGKKQGL